MFFQFENVNAACVDELKQTTIIPGRIQTWRWRRGSAKCRGRQRMKAEYSPCCAHETLLEFSESGERNTHGKLMPHEVGTK